MNVLVEYINNHLGEDIDLNKLAEISGFSRWHFHRIFAEFLGEPVGTFIVRMRVETAARLLRYTEIPVKEIAYKVGYDVPSSLSKVFRQFYGISPNEYRNNKDYVIMEPNRIMPDMELKVEVKDLPGKQVAYIRLNGEMCIRDRDVYWTVMGQNDPVEYMQKHPDRIKVLHIKDRAVFGQSGMMNFEMIFKQMYANGIKD